MLDQSTQDSIRKQVEFYFSDSNLPRDNFLKAKVAEDADGFVDLGLLCTFSRMQNLLNATTRGPVEESVLEEVANILKTSRSLVISDDNKRVRRAEVLKADTEIAKEVDSRTLYASPFPFDTTLDALTEFFNNVGSVNCIRLRRHITSKDFKGSIFIEFNSDEEAQRVKDLKIEFEGAPLHMEPKAEYVERKQEERKNRPNAVAPTTAAAAGPSNFTVRGANAVPVHANANASNAAKNTNNNKEVAEPAAAPTFEPGCVLRFDFEIEGEFSAPVNFGLIKDSFGGSEGGVAFIDYNQGAKSGYARFSTPDGAKSVVDAAEGGKRMIAGYSAAVVVLTGTEEEEYFKAARAHIQQHREGGGRGGRGGKRKGDGGRGGRGKRGRRN